MNEKHNTADMMITALRRAWRLGQTYWRQADSEYPSQWEKADETQATFNQLVKDTRAALTSNSGAQPASDDEYVGWYCAHCQRGVDASEVTYHEQHEACGCVITDDRPPKSAPGIPEGWLRAIDEALVVTHIGVANASDTYEQAKVKLDSLIGFHVDVATDPSVNGGWKLVLINPTKTFYQCFSAYDGTSYSNSFDYDDFVKDWSEALATTPEAKL